MATATAPHQAEPLLMREGLITLNEAAEILSRTATTVTRWSIDGVTLPDGKLIKLETIRIGARLQTSREAVFRFVDRQQSEEVSNG